MFVLITGGSGSGKSEVAEDFAVKMKKGQLFYLATMMPFGKEGKERIERHRQLRSGKGFMTVECQRNIEELQWEKTDTVLLECMSNLAANEFFSDKTGIQDSRNSEYIKDKIISGIKKIINTGANLVVVTNEVFSDGIPYDEETVEYIRLLGKINREMAVFADEVYEVVVGIPLQWRKDDTGYRRCFSGKGRLCKNRIRDRGKQGTL